MDPNGRIYEADPEQIPDEDKARLEGYLRGRAEADAKARLIEEFEALNRAIAEKESPDES